MIEDIEKLRPELQANLVRHTKLPTNRKIILPCAEAAQEIARKIALSRAGRAAKRCPIKRLAAGELGSIDIERYPRYDVWPCGKLCAGHNQEGVSEHRDGRR